MSDVIRCNACQIDLPGTLRFCPQCGTQLPVAAPPQPPEWDEGHVAPPVPGYGMPPSPDHDT